MRCIHWLAATVGLALSAPAQAPRVDPLPFRWATGALETGFPFGHPNRRLLHYQEVHDGLAGHPRTVTAMAIRRSALDSQPVPAFRADLAMRLGTARTTAATVVDNFANNQGLDAVQVLPRRLVSFAASPGVTTVPARFEYAIPADLPFAFGGRGPLCVEFVMFDHTNPATTRFELYAEGFSHAADVGSGCGSIALATRFAIGAASHDISGVPASTPVLAMFAARFDASAGVPLPIDLSPFGATGCALRVDPLFAIAGVTDASGAFSVTMPFASPATGGFYGVQALAAVPGANPLGLVTSNAQVIVPSTTRVAGRVWAEDPLATTGQRQPNAALVIEVR